MRAATLASWISRRGLARGGRLVARPAGQSSTAAAPSASAVAERGEFLDLLHREGEPALDFGIETRFQREIDRDMQQRAGRRELHAVRCRASRRRVRAGRGSGSDRRARCCGRRSRRATARDPSGARRAPSSCSGARTRSRCRPGDRQRQRGVAVVAEPAEIGREHDLELRHRLGDFRIGVAAAPAALAMSRSSTRQGSSICTHSAPAVGEFAQHFDVDRQQPVEQRQRIEAGVLALGELQKRDRPEQHRAGLIAQRLGFPIFLDGLREARVNV